ncbi:hypothetical protein ABIB25_005908 [Nakamurella sp. UYEF19]|uniref:hypothetical protein n=1 Tax=Nakamurella sp. UYEF19 TaxID=1756392 RepID=UPI003399F639
MKLTPAQLEALTSRCTDKLGDHAAMQLPADYGYPDSLALCVIDAVQSTGIKYANVLKVTKNYRNYRLECSRFCGLEVKPQARLDV